MPVLKTAPAAVVVMDGDELWRNLPVVLERLEHEHLTTDMHAIADSTVIGVFGQHMSWELCRQLERLDGVRQAVLIDRMYKLTAREFRPSGTVVEARGVMI